MNYTSIKRWFFCATILATSLLTTAQAAKLEDVFHRSMLGVTQRYFESIAGIPREKYGDTYHFVVEGCHVQAFIKDREVYALRLELDGPSHCHVDLSSFGFNRSTRGLTFGYFTSGKYPEAQHALDPMFYADCLRSCGNAYDPSVYAFWQGPHTMNFLQAELEVVQVSEAAIDAAHKLGDLMSQQMGEDDLIDARFNCDDTFDNAAAEYFENVKVDAITLGYDLKAPVSCVLQNNFWEK